MLGLCARGVGVLVGEMGTGPRSNAPSIDAAWEDLEDSKAR